MNRYSMFAVTPTVMLAMEVSARNAVHALDSARALLAANMTEAFELATVTVKLARTQTSEYTVHKLPVYQKGRYGQ